MKQFYQVPSIKVVSFKVEEGFLTETPYSAKVGDPVVSNGEGTQALTRIQSNDWHN